MKEPVIKDDVEEETSRAGKSQRQQGGCGGPGAGAGVGAQARGLLLGWKMPRNEMQVMVARHRELLNAAGLDTSKRFSWRLLRDVNFTSV